MTAVATEATKLAAGIGPAGAWAKLAEIIEASDIELSYPKDFQVYDKDTLHGANGIEAPTEFVFAFNATGTHLIPARMMGALERLRSVKGGTSEEFRWFLFESGQLFEATYEMADNFLGMFDNHQPVKVKSRTISVNIPTLAELLLSIPTDVRNYGALAGNRHVEGYNLSTQLNIAYDYALVALFSFALANLAEPVIEFGYFDLRPAPGGKSQAFLDFLVYDRTIGKTGKHMAWGQIQVTPGKDDLYGVHVWYRQSDVVNLEDYGAVDFAAWVTLHTATRDGEHDSKQVTVTIAPFQDLFYSLPYSVRSSGRNRAWGEDKWVTMLCADAYATELGVMLSYATQYGKPVIWLKPFEVCGGDKEAPTQFVADFGAFDTWSEADREKRYAGGIAITSDRAEVPGWRVSRNH